MPCGIEQCSKEKLFFGNMHFLCNAKGLKQSMESTLNL